MPDDIYIKTKPKHFRRALFIGLGGSGQKVLVNLKRRFIDECGSVPPCIKFLALDTSNQMDTAYSMRKGEEISLSSQEFMYLHVMNPLTFIKGSKEVQEWFVQDTPIGTISAGTGAVRLTGRVALYRYSREIRARLEEIHQALSDARLGGVNGLMSMANFELLDRDTEICITGSVAGGTGSGTFLDIAILCRHLFPNSFITGVFLLPWIYRNNAATFRTPANSYAALCELDTIQNPPPNAAAGECYSITFGGETIVADKPPFTLFHLIDGRNEIGDSINNANILASCIAEGQFLSFGAVGMQVGDHIDNCLLSVHGMCKHPWNGKMPHYTSFGVSSLVYPAEERHERRALQEAIRLLECAIQDCATSGKEIPHPSDEAQAAVRDFLLENNLARENAAQFLDALFKVSDLQTTFELKDGFSYGDKGVVQTLSKMKKLHLEKLATQVRTRLDNTLNRFKQSLCERIASAIQRLAREESQGRRLPNSTLVWAQALAATVSANRAAFLAEVASVDNHMRETTEGQKIETAALSKKPGLLHLMFGRQRQAACQHHAGSVSREAKLSVERERFAKAAEVLNAVLNTIETSVEELRGIMATTSEAVRHLSAARAKFVARFDILREQERLRAQNPFEIVLGDPQVSYVLASGGNNEAQSVGEYFSEITYSAFCGASKIGNASAYSRKDQDALSDLFLGYTRRLLKPMLNVTLKHLLEDMDKKQPGFKQLCLRDLLRKSSALWYYDNGLLNETRKERMCSVVVVGVNTREADVPAYGDIIKAESPGLHIEYSPSWVSTGDPYRISVLHYAVSLPAYALMDMEKYQREYQKILVPTTHVDKRFEFSVPSLFPESAGSNLAMRVVTLGLVPELGVIRDEKLAVGHRYTVDYEELNDPTDPLVRLDFISLLELISDNENVAKVLTGKIVESCSSLGDEALQKAIDRHLGAMKRRFESRDFTKLITGRFYAGEMQILKDFSNTLRRKGDIKRFLEQGVKK